MMSSSLLDKGENTNISICVPAAQILLAEHLATAPMNTSMGWKTEEPWRLRQTSRVLERFGLRIPLRDTNRQGNSGEAAGPDRLCSET